MRERPEGARGQRPKRTGPTPDATRGLGQIVIPDNEEIQMQIGAILQGGERPMAAAGPMLARALGNWRFGQLAAAARQAQRAPDPEAPARTALTLGAPELGSVADQQVALSPVAGEETLRRQAQGGRIVVSLNLQQTATVTHTVHGETMEEVCKNMPDIIGEFLYEDSAQVNTETTEEGDTWVTQVTIPVEYHYNMPSWPELSNQPQKVKTAWQGFYNDVMKHEQEHLGVCRRYYTDLKNALAALRGEDRTEAKVLELARDSIARQNEAHDSHAGFATAAFIDPFDYLPAP